MFEVTLKLCLGILLGGISFYGLIANALVVVPVYRLAFVSKRSPIYVISLVNLFADIINLIITTCYLAPLILTTAYTPTSTTDLKISLIFGTGFMFCWYLGSITQIIMAVNRLVVICFKCPDLFSRKLLLVIFSFIFPLCTAMTYLAQFGFPCCALVYDSRILSISYLSTGAENFSNMFIDVPLNFTTSFTAFVCYSMITLKIWNSKKMVLPTAGNKEYAYATQFCLITVFYTISWILFRIFPLVLGNQRVEFYCFVMIAVSLNNSANAAVYICFNKEVKRHILRSRFLIFPASGSQSSIPNENQAYKLASSANFPSTIRQNEIIQL
ncbi:hypothetical protein B9Z55_020060 [Caenorhabditis nigoni]|uniref:7TM GPCR serpentine receptor class x (Srx) domain-containing protein n=1 Tax=Caenorhabditis nigoni TaxID=1611254 RepID=A0A2G5TL16_9PELO|nr:hypothetical protein B9Z55_020060 [Caenorhabditis nigoni]